MSFKNIALTSGVYTRLAQFKKESESFSKAVNRMLDQVSRTHTGQEILAGLSTIPSLAPSDAESMLDLIEDARKKESWESHDLR